MIWRTRIFIATIALLFGLAGDAKASFTINFDDNPAGGLFSSGTQLSTQYAASRGLRFLGFENGSMFAPRLFVDNSLDDFPADPNAVGSRLALWNVQGEDTSASESNRLDVVQILFDQAVSSVAFRHNGTTIATTFNVYDVNGNLLPLAPSQSNGINTQDISFVHLPGIGRLDILQGTETHGWRIDNLTADFAAVPEPSSMIMVAACAGAAGVGAWRRRFKRGSELKRATAA